MLTILVRTSYACSLTGAGTSAYVGIAITPYLRSHGEGSFEFLRLLQLLILFQDPYGSLDQKVNGSWYLCALVIVEGLATVNIIQDC